MGKTTGLTTKEAVEIAIKTGCKIRREGWGAYVFYEIYKTPKGLYFERTNSNCLFPFSESGLETDWEIVPEPTPESVYDWEWAKDRMKEGLKVRRDDYEDGTYAYEQMPHCGERDFRKVDSQNGQFGVFIGRLDNRGKWELYDEKTPLQKSTESESKTVLPNFMDIPCEQMGGQTLREAIKKEKSDGEMLRFYLAGETYETAAQQFKAYLESKARLEYEGKSLGQILHNELDGKTAQKFLNIETCENISAALERAVLSRIQPQPEKQETALEILESKRLKNFLVFPKEVFFTFMGKNFLVYGDTPELAAQSALCEFYDFINGR